MMFHLRSDLNLLFEPWDISSTKGEQNLYLPFYEMNMCPSQLNRNLSNCGVARKKVFSRGFNGFRTRGLGIGAAVLYQLSYEDPYTGSRPVY